MGHEHQPKAKIERALSKGVRAAQAAAMTSGAAKHKDPFDTNEKKIVELRKQREANLAVVRYDFIDALIEEHDRVQKDLRITNLHNEDFIQSIKKDIRANEERDAAIIADLTIRAEAAEEELAQMKKAPVPEPVLSLSDSVQAELVEEGRQDKELSEDAQTAEVEPEIGGEG